VHHRSGRNAPQGNEPRHELRIRPVFTAFGSRHRLFPEPAIVAPVLDTQTTGLAASLTRFGFAMLLNETKFVKRDDTKAGNSSM
jgi:hypothetical protein